MSARARSKSPSSSSRASPPASAVGKRHASRQRKAKQDGPGLKSTSESTPKSSRSKTSRTSKASSKTSGKSSKASSQTSGKPSKASKTSKGSTPTAGARAKTGGTKSPASKPASSSSSSGSGSRSGSGSGSRSRSTRNTKSPKKQKQEQQQQRLLDNDDDDDEEDEEFSESAEMKLRRAELENDEKDADFDDFEEEEFLAQLADEEGEGSFPFSDLLYYYKMDTFATHIALAVIYSIYYLATLWHVGSSIKLEIPSSSTSKPTSNSSNSSILGSDQVALYRFGIALLLSAAAQDSYSAQKKVLQYFMTFALTQILFIVWVEYPKQCDASKCDLPKLSIWEIFVHILTMAVAMWACYFYDSQPVLDPEALQDDDDDEDYVDDGDDDDDEE